MEQQVLFDRFDDKYNFYHEPNGPVCNTPVPIYYCPSDRPGARWSADKDYYPIRCRSNYAVNWSNGTYQQTNSDFQKGPFGINSKTKISDITDGTSKTMLMAELLVAETDDNFDYRGDIFDDYPGCAIFMTVNTPNSGYDTARCIGGELLPAPCRFNWDTSYVAARSNHSGGVMSVFADGSTHFISEMVDIAIWKALGAMQDGVVIEDGNYN